VTSKGDEDAKLSAGGFEPGSRGKRSPVTSPGSWWPPARATNSKVEREKGPAAIPRAKKGVLSPSPRAGRGGVKALRA